MNKPQHYFLRDVPPDVLAAVHARAHAQGVKTREAIIAIMRLYASGAIRVEPEVRTAVATIAEDDSERLQNGSRRAIAREARG
jgi:hypothetical protein